MSMINLLPEDYIERRGRRRANVLCLGLFVIVMIAVLGAWTVSERRLGHTEEVLERLNQQYTEAARQIDQMQRLEIQRQGLRRKAERTAALVGPVPQSTVLAVISNARPENLCLLEMELMVEKHVYRASRTTKFAREEDESPAEVVHRAIGLEITGLAGTDVEVAKFIANLVRHPLVEPGSVDLVYSEGAEFEDEAVRQFEIRLALRSNADVVAIAEEMRPAEGEPVQSPEPEPGTGTPAVRSSWWSQLGDAL